MTTARRATRPRLGLLLAVALAGATGAVLAAGGLDAATAALPADWIELARTRLGGLRLASDVRLRWVGVGVAALAGLCLVQFQLLDWRSRRLVRRLRERQSALSDLEARLCSQERDRDRLAHEYETLRNRHRELFEDAHDLTFKHDLEGKLLALNEEGARALGWTSDELLGHDIAELLTPQTRALQRELLGQLVANRGVRHELLSLLDRHGRVRWYDVTLRFEGGEGVARAVEGIGRDVTEPRREEANMVSQSRIAAAMAAANSPAAGTEAALQALCSELLWDYAELWCEDSSFGVLRCDSTFPGEGAVYADFARRAATKTFGKGVGLAGRAWGMGAVLWIPDLGDDPSWKRLSESSGFASALAIPMRDGANLEGVVVLLGARVRGPDDVSTALLERLGTHLCQLRKRKLAEHALRGSEARKQAILESALDCIVTVDHERRVLEFNPAAERTFGYRRAQVLGQVVDDLIVPPDERDAHRAGFQRFLETGIRALSGRIEMTAQRADGSTFPIEIAVTPIYVGDRPIFTAHLRDITERKEIENLKDELVSTVSHELRTPLASVRGFVELLLLRDYSLDEQRRFLGIIDQEIRRLGRLIDDFLDLQRLEAGKLDYELEEADLLPLVRDAIETFRASNETHRFELEVQVDRAVVRVDADRIRQVMLNLLSNAVKYSPDGGDVRVGVTVDEGAACVSVADEGIGMTPEAIANLFTKFYRADSAITRRIGGTGLGLALVREILTAHGGDVAVSSEAGRGSCFTFSLPLSGALARDGEGAEAS